MERIRSTGNDRIKHARRVRDGQERGLCFVEGERLAGEAIAAGLTVVAGLVTADFAGKAAALGWIAPGGAWVEVEDAVMASLADTVTPQGVVLLVERPVGEEFWSQMGEAPLLLGLDRIQDPGNLGTLLRTAEAAGVDGVVLLQGSADPWMPKVLRSAMGSAFRLPLLTGVSFDELWSACAARGIPMIAAAGEAAMDYRKVDWSGGRMLLLGNEGRGIEAAHAERCAERVRIPMRAPVESLNVAAAGAVLLFEAARGRGWGD